MQKCRELSRLAKPSVLKSLQFAGNLPGQIAPLYGFDDFTPSKCLDPSHPLLNGLDPNRPFNAAVRRQFTLPRYQDPDGIFAVRLLPHGLLNKRELLVSNPFNDGSVVAEVDALERARDGTSGDGVKSAEPQLVERRVRKREQTPVSWATIVGKASVHKSSCVRTKIALRLKTAASLIAIRGADVRVLEDDQGAKKEELIWKDEDVGGDKWFLEGWTYSWQPRLEVYRMSYIDLVRRMRPALLAVNARAVKMERQWSAQSRSPYGRAAAARENPPLERTRRRLALDPSRGPSISSFLHASPDRQFPRTQSNDTVVHKQRGIPFPGPRLSQPPSTQRDPHPRSEVAPYDFLYPEHPSQEHFPAPHKGSSRPSSRADHVHESGKRQPARSFSPFERTAPSHARFDPQRDREGPRTFPIHRPVNRPVGMDRPHGARSSPLAGQQGAADRRIPGCTLRAEGEPEANAGSGDVSRRNGRSALFASKPIVLDLVRDPDDTRGPGRARGR